MKVINLNESQYQRLFELSQTATALGDDNPSGVPPLSLDQTWITADILKKNGEVSPGEPKDTDAKQDQMSNQQWGVRTNGNTTNTI